MAESRNRKLVRQLLKKLLRDDRAAATAQSGMAAYMRAYRRNLKGSVQERTGCIRRANDYLAQLKLAPEVRRELPPSLNATVNECRKIGGSIRLTCTARMQAIEKLLFLDSIPVPQTDDATWQYIHRELGTSATVKPLSPTQADYRVVNRQQALVEIVECFRADAESSGRTSFTVEEVLSALRLPEQPVVLVKKEPVPMDAHKETLDKALELIGRMQ
jgi:hypothetical protein